MNTSSTVSETSDGDIIMPLNQFCTHSSPVLTTTLLFSLSSSPPPKRHLKEPALLDLRTQHRSSRHLLVPLAVSVHCLSHPLSQGGVLPALDTFRVAMSRYGEAVLGLMIFFHYIICTVSIYRVGCRRRGHRYNAKGRARQQNKAGVNSKYSVCLCNNKSDAGGR
jgi:hypothetical protein